MLGGIVAQATGLAEEFVLVGKRPPPYTAVRQFYGSGASLRDTADAPRGETK